MKLEVARYDMRRSVQKSPALRGFYRLRPQGHEAVTPTSESHNRYATTAISKMIAQKHGKSKLPVR
jgi:hypothetical protein